jgi:hypothetical protein
MKKQTLKQAITTAERMGALRCGLGGCPQGGWPETRQAMERIEDCLPRREMRTYALQDFVDALYTVDHAGRYQVRHF